MTDDSVPVPNVRGELCEFRPVKVFTGSLVDETLVKRDAFKLAQLLLSHERRHSGVYPNA